MRDIHTIESELKDSGYDTETIESVREIWIEKYLLGRENPDVSMFDFRHRFGLGKTTFGLMNATVGDIFVSATHNQTKENQEHFNDIRKENSIRIVGWEFAIGYNTDNNGNIIQPTDKQKEVVPKRFQKYWNSTACQELRKYTQQYGSSSGRLYYKIDNIDSEDDVPPILEEWGKQFEKDTWKNNVIFCCSARIKQITRRAWLGETDLVLLDEGVEESKPIDIPSIPEIEGFLTDIEKTPNIPTGDREGIAKEIENIENPDGYDYSSFSHFMKSQVNHDYPKPIHIDEQYLQKTLEMMRKIYHRVWKEAVKGEKILGETDYGQGLTKEFFQLIPDQQTAWNQNIWDGVRKRNNKTGEFYYKKGFDNKWKGMGLKTNSRIDVEIRETLQDDSLSDTEKKQRIEWFSEFRKLGNKLWDIRGTRLQYERKSNEMVENLRAEKPMLFYLWDIAESNNNDTEMWILDATAGKEYKDGVLKKRFQYHKNDKKKEMVEVSAKSCYLGDGNTIELPNGQEVEFESRSYEDLEAEELEPNYRRFHLEYNQEGEKDSFPRKILYDNGGLTPTGKEIIRLIREERFNKGKIGVVTYKEFAEHINRFVSAWTNSDGKDIPVATHFAQSEGTNDYDEVETLFVIGKPNPDWVGKLDKYLEEYREVPRFVPKDFSSMRITEEGALRGYRDQLDEAELLDKLLKEEVSMEFINMDKLGDSSLGHRQVQTYWKDYWKRNIENPVFDSYFRMRNQFENKGGREVIRLGIDVKGFIGDTEGSLQDLISEKVSNKTVVEDWEEIEAKKFYSDRTVCNSDLKLKKPYKMYRKIEVEGEDKEQLDVSRSTIYRYNKKWEKNL